MASFGKDKKTIFSAAKPTGDITLGNYIGAIKNWINYQDDYNCVYCVADMHAITVRIEPAELRRKARELFTLYIACGLDPKKSILYFQSHVPAHAELAWALSCHTYIGELSRMTQYKEKSRQHADNINAGLFTYPVLMAADILLFQTHFVPVGEDQKQHVELTRDIAGRFNNLYGDTFTLPEPLIPEVGARIMNLRDPLKKMSKSETDSGSDIIYLLDGTDSIISKFKRATTDSEAEIRFSPEKPGISNLLTIYAAVTGKTTGDSEREFAGVGYGGFKLAVGEAVASALRPIREEYERLSKDKAYIDGVIAGNAADAAAIAGRTLSKVWRKVGFPVS